MPKKNCMQRSEMKTTRAAIKCMQDSQHTTASARSGIDWLSSSGQNRNCWHHNGALIIVQYAKMTVTFGECQRNARAVEIVYAERFSMDRHPTHRTIRTALCHYRDIGTAAPSDKIEHSTHAEETLFPIPTLPQPKWAKHLGYTRQFYMHMLRVHTVPCWSKDWCWVTWNDDFKSESSCLTPLQVYTA